MSASLSADLMRASMEVNWEKMRTRWLPSFASLRSSRSRVSLPDASSRVMSISGSRRRRSVAAWRRRSRTVRIWMRAAPDFLGSSVMASTFWAPCLRSWA